MLGHERHSDFHLDLCYFVREARCLTRSLKQPPGEALVVRN